MLRNFKQRTNTFSSVQNIYTHSWMIFFWPFIVAHTLFNGTTWTRSWGGESEVHWLDFSVLDVGLSRSIPRAACFLFKMYGCVNVCVCTYNPTSIDCLFLFSFCFQLWLWFHLPSATCVELHPRFLCDLWRSNPEFGIGAHQISLCSTPTHTPFWSMCKHHYWFPSKLASVSEVL